MRLSLITPIFAAFLLTAGPGIAHFDSNGGDIDPNGGDIDPNGGDIDPNGGGVDSNSCEFDGSFGSDCDGNGVLDECDITDGTADDCNLNGVPDLCEPDCDENGVADDCDPDCNNNNIPDHCEIDAGFANDCNSNGIPDICDLIDGTSLDCNWNAILDECELLDGGSLDCNSNGVPDECDIYAGASEDNQHNGIPDECETLYETSVVLLSAREPEFFPSPLGDQLLVVRESEGGHPRDGFTFSPEVGKPDLGMRVVEVLLPYDASFKNIRLNIQAEAYASLGNFPVAHVALPVEEISGELVQPDKNLDASGRDFTIYGEDEFWPGEPVKLLSHGQHRALRYVRIAYHPYRWNPASGELQAVAALRCEISWAHRTVNEKEARLELGDPVLLSDEALDRFINVNDVAASYTSVLHGTRADYVIICSRNTLLTSTELKNFVDHKRSQGRKVRTVVVEWISARHPKDDLADSIRTFLRENYQTLGIKDVLLIGDPDPDNMEDDSDSVGEVPMKMLWPRGDKSLNAVDMESSDFINTLPSSWSWDHKVRVAGDNEKFRPVPSDLYYSDLTSASWDWDHDGRAGEWKDDKRWENGKKIRPVDFDAEVRVGRIPFDSLEISHIDDVLKATIDYQSTSVADLELWERDARDNVIVAMGESMKDTLSHRRYLAQAIKNKIPSALDLTRLCERPIWMFSGVIALENRALYNHWSGSFGSAGLVTYTGHGSARETRIFQDDSVLMDVNSTYLLNDDTRAYVYCGSCLNAETEVTVNLAEALLRNIAVGVFACTRVCYGYPMRYEFGDNCYNEDAALHLTRKMAFGQTMGKAISSYRSTRDVAGIKQYQNLLTLNAYGDPDGKYLWVNE